MINVKKSIKGRIFLIAVLIILFLITRPRKKIIYSPLEDGRSITVLQSFPRRFGGKFFVIPGNYRSFFPPKSNYVSIQPQHEQVLYINWHPNDGFTLKIGLPLCGQQFSNKLDTSKYLLTVLCGTNEGYLDKGESYYYPKYKGYVDWFRF